MLTQTGESDLIDRLVRHGLGQGEARCYIGMLAPRAFRASEVAIEAGLPRSRTYELIRSLVRFGLCTEVAGGGVSRFRAVPPNEAILRLETSLAEQARRRDLALNGILHALKGRGDPRAADREPVEMLHRRDQIITEIAVAGSRVESLRIRHAGLGQTFHDAFERLWRRGVPFGRALEGNGGPAPDGATIKPRGTGELRSRGQGGRSAEDD